MHTHPGASKRLTRLTRALRRPLERFLKVEAASGIVLLAATATALMWANSSFRSSYEALWQTSLSLHVGGLVVGRTLEWFVNDALMVVFFFVVGLEIRREIHSGELSEFRRATLPVVAALGGMVVPAVLYRLVAQREASAGWGVPMATDIAFAVGVLTLLGKRVPPALRVLLLALAVIDDLGAIVIIALFYSAGITWSGLVLVAVGLLGIVLMQRFGVRRAIFYGVPSLLVWAGFMVAGVHPTMAGVVVGLLTPVTASPGPVEVAQTRAPVDRLIDLLHPWVAFGIMPLFALCNAGVSLAGFEPDALSYSVIGGVGLGLLFGKPLGILLACFLALKAKISELPLGIEKKQLLVLGMVAGIGFTMSLFVAQLAFFGGPLLAAAKIGVLLASTAASIVGLLLGVLLLPRVRAGREALDADEAEQSTET
jgi:Na+:H+ antiporter, NhaA family